MSDFNRQFTSELAFAKVTGSTSGAVIRMNRGFESIVRVSAGVYDCAREGIVPTFPTEGVIASGYRVEGAPAPTTTTFPVARRTDGGQALLPQLVEMQVVFDFFTPTAALQGVSRDVASNDPSHITVAEALPAAPAAGGPGVGDVFTVIPSVGGADLPPGKTLVSVSVQDTVARKFAAEDLDPNTTRVNLFDSAGAAVDASFTISVSTTTN
jgi:hypothetical protein